MNLANFVSFSLKEAEADPAKAETTLESKEAEKDIAQSNQDGITNQDLTHALVTADSIPSAEELSDAILPVASLSEPLMTTLEMLENENVVASKPEDGSTSTTLLPSTPSISGNIPSAESQDPTSSKPNVSEENPPAVIAPSDTTTSEDGNKKDDPKTLDSEITAAGQDTAPPTVDDQSLTKAENPVLEASSVPPMSVQSTSGNHDDSDVDMATSQPDDTVKAPVSNNGDASEGAGLESKQGDDPQPNTAKELDTEGKNAGHTESGMYGLQVGLPSPQPKPPGASTPVRTSPTQSLPPLSSIAPTQPPSDVPQGLSRHSRSSMSVSALLVSNDEDSEQEPDHGRRMSRSIFEQFEAPAQKPSHSPTLTAPSLQPILSAHGSSTAPQNTPASGQAPSPSIPSHSGSGASLHRMLDTAEMPPLHSSYNRSTTELGHTSSRSQDLSRGGPSKDYPADEVMESGGVSGYGVSRHRLVSPVGVRPLQDSINGSSGGGSVNNKLPGVGSMTGPPVHDAHGHSGSGFRNEATHRPRQNSYSSSQHSMMAHPTNANGHYPSTVHPAHPSSASSQSSASIPSAIVSHHPKLIVKNDPSLATSDRPELFLGMSLNDLARRFLILRTTEHAFISMIRL